MLLLLLTYCCNLLEAKITFLKIVERYDSEYRVGGMSLLLVSSGACLSNAMSAIFIITVVIYRLGRRYILWITSTGQFIFGIAVAFTFNYNSFVIVRFLLAMVRVQAYLLSNENIGVTFLKNGCYKN